MKSQAILLFMSATLFFACSNGGGKDEGNGKDEEKGKKEKKEEAEAKNEDGKSWHGEEFDTEGAMAARKLPAEMEGKDSTQVKLKGKVTEVCQKKGCWMELDMGEEDPSMMVRFKDYGFFVPKDAAGSRAIMEGWAYNDTVSVETLRHYAKDKGKSQEAIDSIQEPEVRLAFKADGVLLEADDEG